MKFARKFLADLAKLKLPVTAAAAAALVVSVVDPFGLHVSGTVVSGALVAVGAVAAYINHLIAD